MAQEIAFEKGRISNYEVLVTLTLTSDRVILHVYRRRASLIDFYNMYLRAKFH